MSKKKKVFIILGIIIAVIVVLSAACSALSNVAMDVRTSLEGGVPAQEVITRDLSSVIYANGTVESQHKVSVTTELTGQVKELYVQLGDYVDAGTPLLVMDDTEIREKIAELEKQVSDQNILSAKEKEINQRNLDYAKEEQTRLLAEAQKLIDAAVTEEEKNEAKANYDSVLRSTNQQIQAAQDVIDTQDVGSDNDSSVSATLTELYNQLDKITITAPQAGIITALNISTGSMVTTGDLMVIEDNKNLKLTVSIQENDILKLATGMHAVIKADALEGIEMSGTVNKVINFATSGSGNMYEMEGMASSGSYSAEILIEGETRLLLGMNAKAEIVLAEKKDALSVAYDSIFTEENGDCYIYLAQEDSKAEGDMTLYTIKKVPVTKGDEGDYYTEIITDEIKEGDIIVSYPEMVNEGDTIALDIEIIEE